MRPSSNPPFWTSPSSNGPPEPAGADGPFDGEAVWPTAGDVEGRTVAGGVSNEAVEGEGLAGPIDGDGVLAAPSSAAWIRSFSGPSPTRILMTLLAPWT